MMRLIKIWIGTIRNVLFTDHASIAITGQPTSAMSFSFPKSILIPCTTGAALSRKYEEIIDIPKSATPIYRAPLNASSSFARMKTARINIKSGISMCVPKDSILSSISIFFLYMG